MTSKRTLDTETSTIITGIDSWPFSGDFDGQGKDDIAVYERSKGKWMRNSREMARGGEDTDVTLVTDMDNDRKTDVVFFRPAEGLWITNGKEKQAVQFGQDGDVPIPADYDGDGKNDYAVYRPSTGSVFILGLKQEFKFDRRGLIPLSGGK